MSSAPARASAWSGWLVGLIALAGGLAAPQSAPVAGPRATPAVPSTPAPDPVTQQVQVQIAQAGVDPELAAFYASRRHAPLWVEQRRLRPQALDAMRTLLAADAEGLNPSDYDVGAVQAALEAAAKSGRPADLARADLALSGGIAAYGADLHRPKPAAQLLYSDAGLRPPAVERRAVLERLAAAPTLEQGLADLRRSNPIYQTLRTAWLEAAARGDPEAAVLRANLERARALPIELGRRYILVDIAAQRLIAYENDAPVITMKVVVGKPSEPTPAMAALVRYAVFRPYWNVPPDLVASSWAPRVLQHGKGGAAWFRAQNFEALSDWTDQAKPLNPQKINWRAVASGRQELRVRQKPGRGNMMGQVKFMFPNALGVYLHDSPIRGLFGQDERLGSAGCVRLEDALRLSRWLVGDAATAKGQAPGPAETRVDLAEPAPVYIVYLTAAPGPQGITTRRDIYGRDAELMAQLGTAPARMASAGKGDAPARASDARALMNPS